MDRRSLQVFSFVGLIFLFALPGYYFNSLPESIPTHFGFNGMPDAYGSKSSIWILPSIGLVVFLVLSFLSRMAYKQSNQENLPQNLKSRKERIGGEMLDVLNAFILWSFVYIVYCTIQITRGQCEGLGSTFIIYFSLILLGIIVLYLFRMKEAASSEK